MLVETDCDTSMEDFESTAAFQALPEHTKDFITNPRHLPYSLNERSRYSILINRHIVTRQLHDATTATYYGPSEPAAPSHTPDLATTADGLTSLPLELLENICEHMNQSTVLNFMLTCVDIWEIAHGFLFVSPEFDSTYRFAQFAQIVTEEPLLAATVRHLDLTGISGYPNSGKEPEPKAGWREFKYRHHDMWFVHQPNYTGSANTTLTATSMSELQESQEAPQGTHPPPSPLLKNFERSRDVPIGTLCRVLAACQGITSLNFSNLLLASDFLVLPRGQDGSNPVYTHNDAGTDLDATVPKLSIVTRPSTLPTPYIPLNSFYHIKPPPPGSQSANCARSPLVTQTFTSTIPHSQTWASSCLLPLYADEVIFWLTQLPSLADLMLRGCGWLSTVRARYLLARLPRTGVVAHGKTDGKGVRWVDFTGASHQKQLAWATEGSRDKVEGIMKGFSEDAQS